MNKVRQLLPWAQLILAAIVFLIVLSLAIVYQDQLKEAVLVPLLYLFWVGGLVFQSFDQHCIWLLGLLIALFISLAYSRRQDKEWQEKASHPKRTRSLNVGRIHFWRTQIRASSSTVLASSYRHSEIRRLVIKTLAYHQNLDDDQLREKIRSGQIRLPAEVSYIVGIDDRSIKPELPKSFVQRIQQRFVWIIDRLEQTALTPDPELEKVAEYLESIMEVDNDAGNR